MFRRGVFIVAAVFATDPLEDEFFAQSDVFVSNADLNDYSHVFSDDESAVVESLLSDLSTANLKKPYFYSERHMEIIKELAEDKKSKKIGKKTVVELFREAQDRFKAENLKPMNQGSFARYLNVDTIKSMKNRSRDSSNSSASSSRGRVYTAAHDAIVKEVVMRSIHENKLSKETAFREVSERFKAQNLEAISRAAFKYRFNKLVEKETKL
jgi:hypothetical protein